MVEKYCCSKYYGNLNTKKIWTRAIVSPYVFVFKMSFPFHREYEVF